MLLAPGKYQAIPWLSGCGWDYGFHEIFKLGKSTEIAVLLHDDSGKARKWLRIDIAKENQARLFPLSFDDVITMCELNGTPCE